MTSNMACARSVRARHALLLQSMHSLFQRKGSMFGFCSSTQCAIFCSWQKLADRSARIVVVTQDFGNDLSLEAYMQLPVEQYYELDPAMIRPLGGTRFALQVPRVNVGILLHIWRAHVLHCLHIPTGDGQDQQSPHFRLTSKASSRADTGLCLQLFNVWVEPLVEVVVHLSASRDAVVIEVCAITWIKQIYICTSGVNEQFSLLQSMAQFDDISSCTVWHFSQHKAHAASAA